MKKTHVAFTALFLAVSAQSEARKFSHDDVQHGIDIYYGEIIEIEKATTHEAASKGAMIGGVAGLAYGSHRNHHRTKDALAGALAGALLGAMIDSSKKHAHAYTVRLGDGHAMQVVSDNSGGLRLGDCVQVEDGHRVNVRRVSRSFCESEIDEWDVHESRYQASKCDRAKEFLLDVETAEDLEYAKNKVHKYCH